jgi:hypothetical protein
MTPQLFQQSNHQAPLHYLRFCLHLHQLYHRPIYLHHYLRLDQPDLHQVFVLSPPAAHLNLLHYGVQPCPLHQYQVQFQLTCHLRNHHLYQAHHQRTYLPFSLPSFRPTRSPLVLPSFASSCAP